MRTSFKTRSLFVLLAFALAFVATGCVDEAQCSDVCERYQDCYDSDYDVDSCVDSCADQSADDDQYDEQVDVCLSCIDNKSCTESFACAGECSGVVP